MMETGSFSSLVDTGWAVNGFVSEGYLGRVISSLRRLHDWDSGVVEGLVERFARPSDRGIMLLDAVCGDGRLGEYLAQNGSRSVCFLPESPDMNVLCERVVANGHNMSVAKSWDEIAGRRVSFDVVVVGGSAFTTLGRDERCAVLSGARSVLSDGGVLILDFALFDHGFRAGCSSLPLSGEFEGFLLTVTSSLPGEVSYEYLLEIVNPTDVIRIVAAQRVSCLSLEDMREELKGFRFTSILEDEVDGVGGERRGFVVARPT